MGVDRGVIVGENVVGEKIVGEQSLGSIREEGRDDHTIGAHPKVSPAFRWRFTQYRFWATELVVLTDSGSSLRASLNNAICRGHSHSPNHSGVLQHDPMLSALGHGQLL
jgi:hypothetical protein